MTASTESFAYLHPVFPWEGPNGQGAGVTLLILALLVLVVVGLLLFLITKFFRRFL